MEPVIELRNLRKSYKGFEAVNGIDLTVYRGDVFGFLGPNGAGKSTTIRMMMSLIAPTSGEIKIFGKKLSEHRVEILRKTGCIIEKPDLYGYLSAYDNLRLLCKMSGVQPGKKLITDILQQVGLEGRAHSKVKSFTHGMKQRLGIAQALIHDPELIILDEPSTGLDPQGMVEIRELILMLSRQQNKTILLSSHILNEIELVANRMVIINKGKVVVEGEVQKLLNTDDLKVTLEVQQVNEALKLIDQSEYKTLFRESASNFIIMQMRKDQMASLNRFLFNNGIEIISMVPTRSLEEYFLNLT
jgi:ABC-type multidrug transport system ATPase subunit